MERILTTLSALRQKQGLTQSELAKKVGVSQPLLSMIERGEMFLNPTIGEKLGQLLQVDPECLTDAYEDYLRQQRKEEEKICHSK